VNDPASPVVVAAPLHRAMRAPVARCMIPEITIWLLNSIHHLPGRQPRHRVTTSAIR
jgi:hypothetical protein